MLLGNEQISIPDIGLGGFFYVNFTEAGKQTKLLHA
jgi:hypothetical protein